MTLLSPYTCINVRVTKFRPRHKYIRDERQFNAKEFHEDFVSLPFSAIHAYENMDDKLGTFNDLLNKCLERHAPLKHIKVKPPPCPWLKSNEIIELQCERDQLRYREHKSSSDFVWQVYRKVCNYLKTTIKKAKPAFYTTALSSKKPKEVWQVINRILNRNSNPLQCNPN
jgi:hypothetical protein